MKPTSIFAKTLRRHPTLENSIFVTIRHEQGYSVYPIVWVESGKRYIGYCGLTQKVFAVTSNAWKPLIVVDFIIEDGECEERERCLNILCKYNKTTPKSFAKEFHMKAKCVEREWANIVALWSQLTLSDVVNVVFKTEGSQCVPY